MNFFTFLYLRMTLENKVNLDGTEVSKIVEKEVLKCEMRHKEHLTLHIQK